MAKNYKCWQPDEIEILEKYYRKETVTAIHKRLKVLGHDRSESAVWNKIFALGLSKSSPRKFWTATELDIIKEVYPETGTPGTMRALGAIGCQRTAASIRGKAKKMGIKTKLITRFTAGQTAHNKGKKMKPSTRDKVKGTMFQNGHRPHTYKPVGTVVIKKDNTGRRYKYKKHGEKDWRFVHKDVWEQAHGKIPKGKIIVFKNRDTLDCRLENLMILTRAENLMRNRDYTKAAATRKSLADKDIARRLAKGDLHLQRELLKDKELLDIVRQERLLNRAVKNKKSCKQKK